MISKKYILKYILYIIFVSIILLISVSIYFLTQRNKTVVLPNPTGSFQVGRTSYDWIDPTRKEIFAEEANNKRKLSVYIWYPAELKESTKNGEYLPGKWKTEQEKSTAMKYLQQNLAKVHTNSYDNAPLSMKKSKYPMIVFEPGMGKIVFNYTVLAENLASNGYIVIGVNPTYSSDFTVFSDGSTAYKTSKGSIPEGAVTDKELNDAGSKLIKTWAADISFAISKMSEMNLEKGNMWSGHIDMEHIGAFGHSFGGAASVQSSLLDDRIKASIDIDGYLYGVQKTSQKPLMFIMSQHAQKGIDLQEINKIQSVYSSLKKDGYLIEIPKTAHFSFTDDTLFFSPILRIMGIYGTINGKQGLKLTNVYITTFFDKYLR